MRAARKGSQGFAGADVKSGHLEEMRDLKARADSDNQMEQVLNLTNLNKNRIGFLN
jgi:hypothetical protein